MNSFRPLPALLLLLFLSGWSGVRSSAEPGKEGRVLYYTCTMHPSVRSPTPGKCPICSMDLVPVHEKISSSENQAKNPPPGMATSSERGLPISPTPQTNPFFVPSERLQAIGVRTAVVERRHLVRELHAPAILAVDESKEIDINVKAGDGYVIKLYADYLWKEVHKGEKLATILSENWVQAQMDYIRAYRAWRRSLLIQKANPILLDQQFQHIRNRIRVWDLTDAQIRELERYAWSMSTNDVRTGKGIHGTFDLLSPISGHVHEKNVIEGMRFSAGQTLFRLVNLSRIWVLAQFSEDQAPFISEGQLCEVTLPALPAERFRSRIDFVQPHFTEAVRRLQARIILPNPGHKLRPGMYAEVAAHLDYGTQLAVRSDAVIPTGRRFVVFVDHGGGRLEPRFVRLGAKLDDYYQVVSGLDEGERVVTGANFLIDAEARVQGALQIWSSEQPSEGEELPQKPAPSAPPPAGTPMPPPGGHHHHHGMPGMPGM
ncbi:efflux RND transporter periplasmic adaptor subunit [Methylacidimicrobium cyclopophantes]|uniref:efflux RND transporter periplasmic adaptor subunit n=1 Tax=Methylacidimicrobium cyclopophantes TaxID=1041766 RepID=UPI001FE445BE|nr:efflux RND transporter periplasmic adaptor subunit [Methylacidimicrobium cyclopophantes]